MNENSIPDDGALPLAVKQRIDGLCVLFEDAWIAERRPRVEEYLQKVPKSERAVLLREVLRLELHYRCGRGEVFDADEYRARFPGYPQVVAELLEAVASCSACSLVVPEGAQQCPHCGATIPATGGTRARSGGEDTCSVSPYREGTPRETGQELDSEKAGHGRFLPGTLLANRYRVVGLLGRGGMGEVYRADDLKLGQALALKLLPERLAGDADVQTLFRNEVRLARQIAHPNVCRVYDMGEADGQQFLSMEYIDGEDLASLLRRIGRLPPDRGLAVTWQLVAGLAAAHERGILHRDLKPANVMLDGRGQVRITDFGLACLSEAAPDEQIRAGTPYYMAPEQLAGEPVTVRSDLYSLGLVLYEVFTGQRPHQTDSLEELVRLRQRTSPVAPSRIVEGLDPVVEQVLLQLLERDPQDRPPSALAVLAVLPGGDPLQAALAAGETPSPEMVAATRQPGSLTAGVGGFCLAVMLIGLLAVVLLSDRTTLVGQAQLKSPAALAEHARRIIKDHGYEKPPGDWAYGFRYENDPSRTTPISFWYRQSPSVLVPQLFAGSFVAKGDGSVSLEDPPPPIPGEVSVRLNPQGGLIELRAAPAPDSHHKSVAAGSASTADAVGPTPDSPPWCTALFREAGLVGKEDAQVDPGEFIAVPPGWAAPICCDRRMAWQGADPDTGSPVTVEAATLDGKPVFFRVVARQEGPEQHARAPGSTAYAYVRITLFITMMTAAGLLARYNLRRGRGDRKGALRLAYFVAVVGTLSWLLLAGRAANPPSWPVFVMGMQIAVFWSLVVWLFYMALEPYVRRLWPETLVSWNRLLAGRFRDPLVGRDLLIGVVFGVLTKLLWQIAVLAPSWFGLGPASLLGPQRTYVGIPLRPLLGGRYCLGELIHHQATAVISGLIILLLLLLLRFVLRKKSLASGAYVLYGAVAFSAGVGHPYISWIFAALGTALLVVLVMRFGLLALVSWAYARLLLSFPVTADLSAWHASGTTLLPLGLIAALAGYAFYLSLAGRPVSGRSVAQ